MLELKNKFNDLNNKFNEMKDEKEKNQKLIIEQDSELDVVLLKIITAQFGLEVAQYSLDDTSSSEIHDQTTNIIPK